jgi:hypothetical protein
MSNGRRVGRPTGRRGFYMQRYGASLHVVRKFNLDQLDAMTEDARRVLFKVSKKPVAREENQEGQQEIVGLA